QHGGGETQEARLHRALHGAHGLEIEIAEQVVEEIAAQEQKQRGDGVRHRRLEIIGELAPVQRRDLVHGASSRVTSCMNTSSSVAVESVIARRLRCAAASADAMASRGSVPAAGYTRSFTMPSRSSITSTPVIPGTSLSAAVAALPSPLASISIDVARPDCCCSCPGGPS